MNLLNGYILVKEAQKKDEGVFATASALNDLLGRGEVVSTPEDRETSKEFFTGDSSVPQKATFITKMPPVGSTVYFEKNIGNEFELDGQKVKFVKLEDIMGYE